MSKKTQRFLLVTAAFLALIMTALLVYEFAYASHHRRKNLPSLPGGAQTSQSYDPDLLAPGLLKIMEQKLYLPLPIEGEEVQGLIVASYETPRKSGEEGIQADDYLASDQIMLGRALARMGKRADFMRWADAFDQAFGKDEEAYHASYLLVAEEGRLEAQERHWSITLAYTRALLEGYQAFGGKDLEERILQASDRLLPLFQEKGTSSQIQAGPRMLLAYDEWDNPPEGTVPQPGEERPIEYAVGTHLADIDLWALLALSRFDPAWAPLASEWQAILAGARLDSDLPLFASAVEEDGETYIAVTGDSLLSKTGEQVKIALSLAEVGKADRDFISFIRSQLRDDKRLASGWNPATSGAASTYAQTSDYALALLLGRAADDQVLINAAREVVMYAYASSQTSDIFGGWYRAGETDRSYKLLAEDNAAVLVALR